MAKVKRETTEALRLGVGSRARELRSKLGLKMEEVAARAGLSRPFLSRIERNEALPSLPTLVALARALGVDPSHLLAQEEAEEAIVLRASDRPSAQQDGVILEQLTRDIPIRRMQMLQVTVPSGHTLDRRLQRYDEDQCAMCVTGEARLLSDAHTLAIREGDTFYFRSATSYRIENVGRNPLVLLLVSSRRGF